MKKNILLSVILILGLASWALAGTITSTATGANLSAIENSVLGTKTVTWAHLTSTNASGIATDCRAYRTIEVQVKGTWNTGTLAIQGSDDGINYVTLRSMSTQTAMSYTADPTTLIPVFECPAYVKPVLSGAGTDDITVTLVGRN